METLHGEPWADDYFWLRDKANPEVAAYLEAENAYTDAVMKPTEALQDTLYKEMLGRIKETDDSVPYREGGYFYYSRTEEGKQYPIYCRKKGSLDAPEEVTLDLNELAEGQKFMSLGAYTVSDDGNLLAYSTDNTGFREYTLLVKDLRDRGAAEREIAEKVGSVAWAADDADALLHDRGGADQAPVPPLPPRAWAQAARRPRLRGEGRAVQRRRRPHAQQGATCSSGSAA